jgi:hypothetical protein
VPFAAAETLFVAIPKDEDFLALDITHHARAHARTFDKRATNPDGFVAADQQYLIQLYFASRFSTIEEREINLLTLLNPILHPTISNDCVHVFTPSAGGNSAEAMFQRVWLAAIGALSPVRCHARCGAASFLTRKERWCLPPLSEM